MLELLKVQLIKLMYWFRVTRILIAISFELNPSLLCESQLVQMLAVLLHLTTAGNDREGNSCKVGAWES